MYRSLLVTLALVMVVYPSQGQDVRKVPISFLPPPLETATYSLGIYDAKSGKLVRHLQEGATQSAFTVGLNGLITNWDGRDDEGKVVPTGKYAVRGYAVGELKVEGENILGNDWASDDENLRVKHVEAIAFVPSGNSVAVLATMAAGTAELLRISDDGKLLWRQSVRDLPTDGQPWLEVSGDNIAVLPRRPVVDGPDTVAVGVYRVPDGAISKLRVVIEERNAPLPSPMPEGFRPVAPPKAEISTTLADPDLSIRSGVGVSRSGPEKKTLAPLIGSAVQHSRGKDGTLWNAAGLAGLVQTAEDRTVLRKLEVISGEPLPVTVSASTTEDRLYLLEEKDGWQRLRGLSWVETKEEDGKPVSTWQTFFERNIRPPDPAPGLEGAETPVEINPVENPLVSGKPPKIKLAASYDEKGSYLTTADGLRLRRISQRANLGAVRLTKGKKPNSLELFQNDGAAWDEFSIEGAKNMMEFDAGEIDMTADGEKTHPEKAAEPPDL